MFTRHSAFMGGLFINYFNDFGRTCRCTWSGRSLPVGSGETRAVLCAHNRGDMVPLTALTKFESYNARVYYAYNEYRSAQINGSAAAGFSSDQATAPGRRFQADHAGEMGFDYMGIPIKQKARQGLPLR